MIKNRPQCPEVSGEDYSIVLVGDFNPKIYQPSWFASQGLLRESEAEAAEIELIHTDFASFSTDWFNLQVSRNRFALKVNSAAYKDHLRDLVLGTFSLLSHTPISQMGMNYSERLRFKSALDWHCFGHFLIPKSPFSGLLSKPGTRTFAIQGLRPDDRLGYIGISSDPVLLQNVPNEATLGINDHIELPSNQKLSGVGYFLDIVDQEYDVINSRSKELIKNLVDRYVEQQNFDDGVLE